jgi:acetate kinase
MTGSTGILAGELMTAPSFLSKTARSPNSSARMPALPVVRHILTVNSGSSSIKFALYPIGTARSPIFSGKIERIGLPRPVLTVKEGGQRQSPQPIRAADHRAAGGLLLDWLQKRVGFESIAGVGHRVVHGGAGFTESQRITPRLIRELRRLSPFDPEHLPSSIQLMELFHQRLLRVPQVACFDTAFHRQMPRVARLLPLPRRFDRKGIQRFGFHGLSYSYLLEELKRTAGAKAARGRIVMAHLGNGASLAAVRGGKSIDTSMGFTPAAGIPMSTRSGDLDPGLVWFLARTEHLTAQKFHEMIHHQSGLLGVSEISPDMRDLLAQEATDVRAAEAVALFCYQTKKWIGAFAAALGGLETLIFAGGIGENAPQIRARICAGLEFLGLHLDARKNRASAAIISTEASRVTVRVIRTDEEQMIAQAVRQVIRDHRTTRLRDRRTTRPTPI